MTCAENRRCFDYRTRKGYHGTALQAVFTTQRKETITQRIKTRSRAIGDALTTKGIMTMKTCKECIHFRPCRDNYTGAIRPSRPGHCDWPIPDKWPLSMLAPFFCSLKQKPDIHRERVHANKCADECKCFEPKNAKKSTQTKIEGI